MPASISSPSIWRWNPCRASSSPRGRAREALSQPDARRELPRGLSHLADDERGAADPRDPERDGRRRRSGRDVEGRVGARPGGDQPPLRRGARDGRPRGSLQARCEGDRAPDGLGGHLHGEVRYGCGGLLVPSPLVALGQDRPEGPVSPPPLPPPPPGGLAPPPPLAPP